MNQNFTLFHVNIVNSWPNVSPILLHVLRGSLNGSAKPLKPYPQLGPKPFITHIGPVILIPIYFSFKTASTHMFHILRLMDAIGSLNCRQQGTCWWNKIFVLICSKKLSLIYIPYSDLIMLLEAASNALYAFYCDLFFFIFRFVAQL